MSGEGVLECRVESVMDGFFGETKIDFSGMWINLDYIWSVSDGFEEFIDFFAGTVAHESLEMACVKELGIPDGENVWTIDLFSFFDVRNILLEEEE